MTQESLAEQAGISVQGYRNIEGGKSLPKSETLLALSRALGVKLHDLVKPAEPLRHVRFRSHKSLKRREEVLARVSRWLDDYGFLEELLARRREYRLQTLTSEIERWRAEGVERARRAAAEVRGRLALGDEPIRNICGLLESGAGIKLLTHLKVATPVGADPAESGFFGLSVAAEDGGPAVVVNTWERISVERWIFTAAHELGHLLMHPGAYKVDDSMEVEQEEKEANVFASYFLMPPGLFQREWTETAGMALVDRVLKVKRIFRVSYSTVLYRLGEMYPVYKDQFWGRFHDDYKRRYSGRLARTDEPDPLGQDHFGPVPLRSKEPDGLSPIDFTEDRLAALVREAVEQNKISLSRGAEILDVSLIELREWVASWNLESVGVG
jgi:Zn-dependent peptidase ImmA (M78 family)/DNA-binding XRE family transcriptional regulator